MEALWSDRDIEEEVEAAGNDERFSEVEVKGFIAAVEIKKKLLNGL